MKNLTTKDWELILSVLKFAVNDNILNEIYPNRQERVKELIKKIEQ
jgi:hypothetical protein